MIQSRPPGKKTRRNRKPAPGYDGQREPGWARVQKIAEENEGRPKVGEIMAASMNLRESPLYWMWSRKMMDDIQLMAGERYRRCWEALLPYAIVPDLTRTIVDFTYHPDGGLIMKMHEAQELSRADKVIGRTDAELLKLACGAGVTLKDMAGQMYGVDITEKTRHEACTKYLGQRVRDALELLVKHWGLERRRKTTTSYRSFGGLTANSDDWSYDPAVARSRSRSNRRRRRKK